MKIYSLNFAAHTTAIRSLCLENGIEHEIVETSPMSGANKTPEFLKATRILFPICNHEEFI